MDFLMTPDEHLDITLIFKLVELGNTAEFKEWAALWKMVQEIEWERLQISTKLHRFRNVLHRHN